MGFVSALIVGPCVTAPLASIGALADAYLANFESQGWIAAAGDAGQSLIAERRLSWP